MAAVSYNTIRYDTTELWLALDQVQNTVNEGTDVASIWYSSNMIGRSEATRSSPVAL